MIHIFSQFPIFFCGISRCHFHQRIGHQPRAGWKPRLMLGHRFAVPPLLELGHGYHPIWQGTNSPIDDRKNLGMIPICSMVLVYLPTFARTKSPSFVGKYTSTMGSMEHMGSMELSYVDLSTSTTVDPHRLHPGRSSKRAWPRTKSDGFRRKTSEQSFTQFSHLIFMIDFSVCDPSIVSPYYSIKSS
jgi:hypothetical protein